MQIIGLVIFIAFAAVWYLPLYKKQSIENRPDGKTFLKTFLAGMFPAFLAAVAYQSLLGLIMAKLGLEKGSVPFQIIMDIFGFALGEELSKYLFSRIALKKTGFRGKTYTALLFGAVGLGFGVLESFLVISSIPDAIMRGVFSLHVFWQLWMGCFYAEAVEKKADGDLAGGKKAMIKAFAVPIGVHAVHDVSGTVGGMLLTSGDDRALIGAAVMVVSATIDIILLVKVLRLVRSAGRME